MKNNLFNYKDVKRLANSHKMYVKPIGKRELKRLQKIDPTFFKANEKPKEFKYPVFYEKGLSEILEIALLATLRREEGRNHSFSLSIAPIQDGSGDEIFSEMTSQHFNFADPLDFTVENIVKLATALNGTNNQIRVVYNENKIPKITGFLRNWETGLIIESFDVGKLLFSFRFSRTGASLAIIEGREIKFLQIAAEKCVAYMYSWALYKSSFFDKLESENSKQAAMQDYDQLMKLMREHGHGGTLIFVSNSDWEKSVQQPINFKPNENYLEIIKWIKRRTEFWDKLHGEVEEIPIHHRMADDKVEESLKLLAQLTALDGATIVTNDFEVIAFGVKLKPVNSNIKPDEISIFEPLENSPEKLTDFVNIGGTRHQSAAQFIFDNRDAVAVVVSQDGKISVIYWDKEDEKIYSLQHIEYLLP